MSPEAFEHDAPGKVIEAVDERSNRGFAFLPDHLPPKLELDSQELRRALSDADQALSRLDGIARLIERPELLFSAYLRREALLSSKIEGTHTTVGHLALFEVAGGLADRTDDAEDVANYVKAFEYGRTRCEDLPIGATLFRELHSILMASSDPHKVTPGKMRDCMVVIGDPPLLNARFVPPPPQFVDELVQDLEQYVADDGEPALLKLAVAHYQFETIHPFRDGNGRIGRLLINLALQREKILTSPMLYLSAYFERHQKAYYDALLRVSTNNDWEDWIKFFLRGVTIQSRDAFERTERLIKIRADYHDRLKGPRVTQGIHQLIDDLFTYQVISVPMARDKLGVTYQAAKASVEKLIAAGILDERPAQYKGTTYWFAEELIDAVHAPLRPEQEDAA